jgi:cytochrome c553
MIGFALTLSAQAADIAERAAPCLACHGENGQSQTPEVPSLGGQPANYVLIQLYLFRQKTRQVEVMNQMAKDLTDGDLQAFGEFISKLPPPKPPAEPGDPQRLARAQALVAQHRCNFCHAPNFAGQEQVPRLAAQREDYLLKALRDYKAGTRAGYDPAMAEVVQPISDEEIQDLAYFMARQP